MQRDREHRRVFPEDRLRAVAVVHVPVDDRDPADASRRLRVADSDGDVGEDAEAHPEVGERVVTRRPHEGVRIGDRAVEDGVDRRDRAPGSELRDLVGAVAERRLAPRVATTPARELLDPGQVLLGMNAQERLGRRRLGPEEQEPVGQTGRVEQVLEPSLRGRVLRVLARLEPATRGELRRARARVVPHHPLVPDERSAWGGHPVVPSAI